ncbi:hypothetical protein COTS27_00540 [Spirochaetota bacterium]|nr:hypothetical protein COTS27_00540 [Spirochaetota bacterium]
METITFYYPYHVIFAIALPIYIGIVMVSEYLSWHALRRIAFAVMRRKLVYGPNEIHKAIKVCLSVMILLLLTLLLMRPRWGEYYVATPERNVDIVFALDISLSMLARDIYPSRIKKAQTELIEFIHHLNGERAGLVLFSGTAFTHVPLTHDYETLISFIYNIDNDMISRQGTDITKAIDQSLALLNTGRLDNEKIIVLISDGETHDVPLSPIIKKVNQNNAIIYALGIGSEEGDAIPLAGTNDGLLFEGLTPDDPGLVRHEYLRNDKGNIVTTKLNKRALTELSFLTGGKLHIPGQYEIGNQEFYAHIKKLGSYTNTGTITLTQADKFHYLALAVLVLMVGEFIFSRLPRQK